jgi:glycerol-1-phosphatase
VLLIVDLDGVVYRGETPVPGMPALLARRVVAGDAVVYVTNNSRWHRADYAARLRSMGAPHDQAAIVTAARATALALADGPAGAAARPVMIFGGPGLAREVREVGRRTVAPTRFGLAADPGTVVVGVDFELSYRRLSLAAEAVRRGAWFVATNRDPNYPTAEGLAAGAGSIVAALVVAAGREPDLVIGKPEPGLLREAARLAGVDAADAVVIGDNLGTDILAAHRVGARSVLMLTGVTTAAQLAAAPPSTAPTAMAHDAVELGAILDRLSR